MQDYNKNIYGFFKVSLAFLLLTIVAYLPASTFLFYIKNDAFMGYFPPRFFMSESLHAGHLPLWNPYINYGIPQYGDMSSGYWSPINWLIASTIGYNAYTFTCEILLYIFLSGMGMYYLCRHFSCSKMVAFCAGAAYLCCGYNVGHLQHVNWLSGCAFLPFCFLAYRKLLTTQNIINYLLCALAFYFLVSSAHPGIIIAAAYFFFGYIIFQLFTQKNNSLVKSARSLVKINLLLVSLILLLSAGMIAGYLDALPYLTRGDKVSLQDSLLNPTGITSWISLLFPFAVVKNNAWFATDISMRNCYIGILQLALLIILVLGKKIPVQKFLLLMALSFAVLSAGGIAKTIAYHVMPFIGYVRLNGEFRIFTLFSLIVAGSIHFNTILQTNDFKKLTQVLKTLLFICMGVLAFAIINSLVTKESFLLDYISGRSSGSGLKSIVEATTGNDTLLVQSTMQVIFIICLILIFFKKRLRFLPYLIVVELCVASLLNMPFTGVGNNSVAELQIMLNTAPKGIPVPSMAPIKTLETFDEKSKLLGDWSMYGKNIGSTKFVQYPIVLKNSMAYLDTIANAKNVFTSLPFIFNNKKNNEVQVINYTGKSLDIRLSGKNTTALLLQQNYYPHWFANGLHVSPIENAPFISIPIRESEQKVHLEFKPAVVLFWMAFSTVALCLYLVLIFVSPKPRDPSLPHL